MSDTVHLDHPDDTPPEHPAMPVAPRLPSMKAPTAQSMMLAQMERTAANVYRLNDDVIGWNSELARELAEIKTTLAQFQRQQLIEQIALFALVLVALIGR